MFRSEEYPVHKEKRLGVDTNEARRLVEEASPALYQIVHHIADALDRLRLDRSLKGCADGVHHYWNVLPHRRYTLCISCGARGPRRLAGD